QDSGAGLAQVDRDLGGVHVHSEPGPPPAHSVSRATQWGSFGGVNPPVSIVAADSAAAARIEAAGTGLSQVERDLNGIHVNQITGDDQSSSGQFVPNYVNPEYKIDAVARQAYRDRWPMTVQDRAWLDKIRAEWT